MLELQNICLKRDDKQILNNINLKIDSNKFMAITGPNGSGKSSLAKVIMGIIAPDSGTILFDGQDITNMNITDRAKLGIGFAFQQPVVFKGIRVSDLINLAAGRPVDLKTSCSYLSDVGLCAREYIDREINSRLSGGELKRIELAMLIAKNSKLTLFDEPEAGIDLWSFNSLISVFKNMHETKGSSIVVISHQEKILNIADEIVLIIDGKVADIGSKDKILPKVLSLNYSCGLLEKRC